VGSVLTQYTLVLGLFPLVVRVVPIEARQAVTVTALTVVGLALTIASVANGWLGRLEGITLVCAWAVATWIVVRSVPGAIPDDPPRVRLQGRLVQAVVVLVALAVVGLGATVAVRALVRLADLAGVPEFAIAFFGASIGTSAPEIVVDLTALARGAPGIAVGDALGSSLVDSTLSIGVGPTVSPAAVTPRLAVVGSLYAMCAVALVGGVLAVRRRHDRATGFLFIGLYLAAYAVIIGAG
ncbi:MAG: hypothetical protein ICV74_07500, partial [Thermoleophilia bacterium]|nr:hypothetical protein [Thermoleophilia bacterium]